MTTLDVSTDARYRKLVADYQAALEQYKEAASDRKRWRDRLAVRRSPTRRAPGGHWRRPAGSPRGSGILPRAPGPPVPPAPPAPPPQPRERSIYLGDILGFATTIYTPSVTWLGEPDPSPEVDRVYGEKSKRLYWNAKARFERCRQALLDYAQRALTRGTIREVVGRRLPGADDVDETLEAPRREVEAGCREIWALYEREKSEENTYLLLEGLADARFVGLESATVAKMERVVLSLASKGIVKRGR